MQPFDFLAILLTLAATFSWINQRWLKLPTTIGVMMISLALSLVLLAPIPGTDGLEHQVQAMLDEMDLGRTLLHGVLSFLLFAGALRVRLRDLAQHKWVIGALASASVVISTMLVGAGAYLVLGWLGLPVPLLYCLLLGAVISPTDPIAVMGILKSAGAPKSLETQIAGESLFNDGVAVVVFLALLGAASGTGELTAEGLIGLFLREAVGGVILGGAAGWSALRMLSHLDDPKVEVLITLALACGSYALAESLELSAPIAVVTAGLMIGNAGRDSVMSPRTVEHVDTFWELVDEILNAVLFVHIGLEVMVISLAEDYVLAGLAAIPLVLLARAVSVALPIALMRRFRSASPAVVTILTWGGLRGGVSVALALSLPDGEVRDILVTVTYVVVAFSILMQGLTLAPVIRAKAAQAEKELSRTRLSEEGAPVPGAGAE
jgi:CPA1 family monovalent cation:H+ antiporter